MCMAKQNSLAALAEMQRATLEVAEAAVKRSTDALRSQLSGLESSIASSLRAEGGCCS